MRLSFNSHQSMIYPRGFGLIEMVIYVALLVTLFAGTVSLVLTMSTAYAKARNMRNVTTQGIAVMERVIRDTRLAYTIDTGNSTFAANPGILRLLSVTSPTNSASTTRRYSLSGETFILEEGAAPALALTNGVRVTNLVFRNISTGVGTVRAVRVELTVQTGTGTVQAIQNFYGTALLRGGY